MIIVIKHFYCIRPFCLLKEKKHERFNRRIIRDNGRGM